jgi:hypothetical protein
LSVAHADEHHDLAAKAAPHRLHVTVGELLNSHTSQQTLALVNASL